jgi:hypothetical protein
MRKLLGRSEQSSGPSGSLGVSEDNLSAASSPLSNFRRMSAFHPLPDIQRLTEELQERT